VYLFSVFIPLGKNQQFTNNKIKLKEISEISIVYPNNILAWPKLTAEILEIPLMPRCWIVSTGMPFKGDVIGSISPVLNNHLIFGASLV